MGLEKTKFSRFFQTDAACGKVSHTSIFEFHTGICNVGLLGEHWNTDRSDFTYRRRHEAQNDIDIVNHQVKNNIDIQAPWREGSQTMNLEKLGPRRQFTCERDDGIEPLDVTHLKYALVPGCGLDQRSGFFGGAAEEARSLIEAAARNKRILQVGHVERFNPVVALASELATRPQFFEIHRLAAFSPRSLDIDVVLDLMIHDIDVVLSLVPAPVREVRAVGIPVLSRKADIANARVEFEDGCVANFTASRVSFEKTRKLRFFQPHDYISVDYASQTGIMVSIRMGRVTERKLEPPHQEPLKLEWRSFTECVRKRGKPAVSGEDGLRALELAMRINGAITERLVLR